MNSKFSKKSQTFPRFSWWYCGWVRIPNHQLSLYPRISRLQPTSAGSWHLTFLLAYPWFIVSLLSISGFYQINQWTIDGPLGTRKTMVVYYDNSIPRKIRKTPPFNKIMFFLPGFSTFHRDHRKLVFSMNGRWDYSRVWTPPCIVRI